MALGNAILNMMGHQDPRQQLVQAALGGGSTPAGGTGAPGATPAAPPPQAQAYQSPQELVDLYGQLMDRQSRANNVNQGIGLIAASLAQPENRAMIMNSMGGGASGGGGTQPDPMESIMALQEAQQTQQARLAAQARASSIASEFGISEDVAQYLNSSGNLSEVVADRIKYRAPNTEVVRNADGSVVLINTDNGDKIADITGPNASPTPLQQEYDSYVAQETAEGRTPLSQMEFDLTRRERGAPSVNIDQFGHGHPTLPAGQTYQRNADGSIWIDSATGLPQILDVPGGPQWNARQDAEGRSDRATTREENLGTIIVQDMDEALRMLDNYGNSGLEAWLRARMAGVEGTQDYDLNQLLQASMDTISLQSLQETKEVTGAGLGNVSDRQSQLLANAYGSIDIGQSTEQLKDSVARVRNIYLDIIYGRGRGPERSMFRGQPWQPLVGSEWVDDDGKVIPWDEVDRILGAPPAVESSGPPEGSYQTGSYDAEYKAGDVVDVGGNQFLRAKSDGSWEYVQWSNGGWTATGDYQ